MKSAMVAGFVLSVAAACSSTPPKPAEQSAELNVPKLPPSAMPVATGGSPVAMPPPKPLGKCGGTKVGGLAPPLESKTLDGGRTGVNNQRVTLVYFWATWCGPCNQSFPEIEKLWEKDAGRGLDVFAVSVDDEATNIPNFVKQHQARFQVAWDDKHTDAQCWKVDTMPMAYVIDRAGVTRFIHAGSNPGDIALIDQEIESLL